MIQTRISFQDDGTILVEGAPGPMPCYTVKYGQVALTEAQATQAEHFGWTILLGPGNNGLAVVQRTAKEWRDAAANVRQRRVAGAF